MTGNSMFCFRISWPGEQIDNIGGTEQNTAATTASKLHRSRFWNATSQRPLFPPRGCMARHLYVVPVPVRAVAAQSVCWHLAFPSLWRHRQTAGEKERERERERSSVMTNACLIVSRTREGWSVSGEGGLARAMECFVCRSTDLSFRSFAASSGPWISDATNELRSPRFFCILLIFTARDERRKEKGRNRGVWCFRRHSFALLFSLFRPDSGTGASLPNFLLSYFLYRFVLFVIYIFGYVLYGSGRRERTHVLTGTYECFSDQGKKILNDSTNETLPYQKWIIVGSAVAIRCSFNKQWVVPGLVPKESYFFI